MKLWRLRQELIRFPIALWVEAGLEGGVKSEAWSRGCDESQEKADGSSILRGAMRRNKLPVATILCCCEGSRDYMRHPATEVTRRAIGLRQVKKRRICVCVWE